MLDLRTDDRAGSAAQLSGACSDCGTVGYVVRCTTFRPTSVLLCLTCWEAWESDVNEWQRWAD